ncbi:hypothetical protein H0264_06285 [Nocardia huaxiensis]|uniref:Uncharacterized protein n=1 Tax=Nocardia huaxiensis TaxID=2755382 RepID=A0A7D6VCK7_9NOCA|nr:hypothetical protein [Nocardia huaxiensis]QLY31911.1 hypothetical protein H0264_06285 [Nocardia huaxiensis]
MMFERMRLPIVTAAVLMVTGCATISGTPAPGEIDVRTLDVGKYSIEPIDTYQDYGHSIDRGRTLAVMRLSDNVVTGLDIDPILKYGTGVQEITDINDPTYKDPYHLEKVLSQAGSDAAQRNGAIFGFASGSSDTVPVDSSVQPPGVRVTVTVLQFLDSTAAKNAAAEIDSADFDVAKEENRSVALQKYPAAHAHWRPGTPTLGATIAHGQYIVNVFASTMEADLTALTGWAEKAFAAQLPLLDTLSPLSPEQMQRLEPDMDMMRRALAPLKTGVPMMGTSASQSMRGFLHWQKDREAARQLYSAASVDRFALVDAYTGTYETGKGNAFAFTKGIGRSLDGLIIARAGDERSAQSLWEEILDAPSDASKNPAGVPDVKCADQPAHGSVNQFACAVRYRRYVVLAWGAQLVDLQQRTAAQYALLANSY